jgi:MFS family permease
VIFLASSLSSVGIAMFDTATAWQMTSLSPSPLMVSAVQVATMAPLFLLTIPAGALTDVLDPRRLLIVSQVAVVLVGVAFAAIASLGWARPETLLATTFLLGAAGALSAPAWQTVTPMLAPKGQLDAAIAINNAGYNVSRALGPALGGLAITAFSIVLPFWIYAVTSAAVLAALLWWRPPARIHESLPTERFLSAMRVGLRYARANRDLDATLIRALAFFLFASAYWALLPLVARKLVAGDAEFYGLMMGVLGLGSIAGSFALDPLKIRLGPDGSAAIATLASALALALFAVAHEAVLALAASFIAGFSWIIAMTTMFVSAQVALPDWVRGRGLAIFLTVYFGAMTAGSALWGFVADKNGLSFSLAVAAAGTLVGFVLTWRWKLETGAALDLAPSMHWRAPAFMKSLDDGAGPVMVTAEYRIDPANRAEFVAVLREVGLERIRDGAYAWNAFEDPNVPGRIIETSYLGTLLELKYREERETRADALLEQRMAAFLRAPADVRYLISPKRRHHRWRHAD